MSQVLHACFMQQRNIIIARTTCVVHNFEVVVNCSVYAVIFVMQSQIQRKQLSLDSFSAHNENVMMKIL